MYEIGMLAVCPYFNIWTNWSIVTKFGMIVITLETTLISYFLISYNSNMADARTCEVGATLAPRDIGPWKRLIIEIYALFFFCKM
jgi:hypothetical protein